MCFSIGINSEAQNLNQVLWDDEPLSSSIDYNSLESLINNPNGDDFNFTISNKRRIKGFGINIFLDTYNIKKDFDLNTVPEFEFEITSKNGIVEPRNRYIKSDHGFYNFYVGQGINRFETDESYSTVILPIAFIHKNANCVHNGILIFSIEENNISNGILQISSETCAYLKFDLIAVLDMENQLIESLNNETHLSTLENEIKSFTNLYNQYDIEPGSFAELPYFFGNSDHVTISGLIDGSNHYSNNCFTRSGFYPLCNELLLPSYSLAKSIAGTITIALIQEKYKNITSESVSIIRECRAPSWVNVTLEDLSDMASGHYLKSKFDYDENSLVHAAFIFEALTHDEKIEIACNSFPKRKNPGKKFVYRTSDTYILGTGINEFIKERDMGDDYFNDVLIPFFDELELSSSIQYSLRTFDTKSQAYTGWGMYLIRDDLKKLSTFLQKVKINNDSLSFLHEALNPNKANSNVAIRSADIFYNNGFWSRRFDGYKFGCKDDVWIPFMSGFGGITFAFFPNQMSYYYFSDEYIYSWEDAVYAAHQIRPFC